MDIIEWGTVVLEKWEIMRWAIWLTQLCDLRKVLGYGTKRGTQAEPARLHWGDRAKNVGETKAARTLRTVPEVKELHQRELWDLQMVFLEIAGGCCSAHAYEEMTQSWGKNPLEWLAGIEHNTHRARKMPDWKSSKLLGHCRHYSEEPCLSSRVQLILD